VTSDAPKPKRTGTINRNDWRCVRCGSELSEGDLGEVPALDEAEDVVEGVDVRGVERLLEGRMPKPGDRYHRRRAEDGRVVECGPVCVTETRPEPVNE
jgi:hypothetical protein